jgi:transcriptional regulator with XRE-family HTH domain
MVLLNDLPQRLEQGTTNVIADSVDYGSALRSLMIAADLASYRALSRTSGVPRSAIDRLRQGQVGQLRVATLQALSQALGVPMTTLVDRFGPASSPPRADSGSDSGPDSGPEALAQNQALRQECDRLQQQLAAQAETVRQQVQQEAIAQLESWLVQWPTAAHAAQQRDDLPAHKLIPLVRPVEALVRGWGVTAIETVAAEVAFDPTVHQPKGALLTPGQPVRVTHVGYRQGDRLLYRARVTPIEA